VSCEVGKGGNEEVRFRRGRVPDPTPTSDGLDADEKSVHWTMEVRYVP